MRSRGFTLVELLVTLVIVGILASAAMPMAELSVQRDKERILRQALYDIRHAIDAYKAASDDGRINKQASESGYPRTLAELVDGIVDARDSQGAKLYFLRKIPSDPFSSTNADAEPWGLRSYASSHEDPQPGRDVFDVYSLASGVGLNGIPYREW